MTVLDYTFERQIELEKKASYELGEERGIKQGIKQGIERGMVELIKKKLARNMSPQEIASDLEESPLLCRVIYFYLTKPHYMC